MITSFRELEHWMRKNNINPAGVTVTLTADPPVAHHIGMALHQECDNLRWGKPELTREPIREGSIFGIRFGVADKRG